MTEKLLLNRAASTPARVWVRRWWLGAQGIETFHDQTRWKQNTFEVYPPHCVACGREWRPDKPWISVYGRTKMRTWYAEWHSEALDLWASTGLGPGEMQVRYLCDEHGDRWEEAMDCQTGETVPMRKPLSRLERAWDDALYWSGTGLRFVWLAGRWVWAWLMYKLFRYRAICVRAAWPPLRQRG